MLLIAQIESTVDLSWVPRPDVWVLVVSLVAGYEWALRRLGPRLGADPAASRRRSRFFYAGVAVVWVAADWPMDTVGDEYMLSVHALQYLLFTLVAAPLLVAGTPGWLFRELTRPVAPVLAVWSRPLVALIVLNAAMVASHLPSVVDLYARSDLVHFALHVAWVAAAIVFWLPILSPVDERPPLSPPLQMGYLFLSSIVPTVPVSFLTWSDTALYDAYEESPKLWGLTPVEDQQLAAVMMKVGGGMVLWGFITVIFFRWARTEFDGPFGRPGRRADPAMNGVSARPSDTAR